MLKNNLEAVCRSIDAACRACGRSPSEVTLVGVTKYSDAAAVNEALALGLEHIAENRVQAAKEKFGSLNISGVTRHLIGHLQSNKAKDAVQLFDLIQSVDSVALAVEINKRAAAVGKVQDILLQVDIAKEEQKFGLPEEDVLAFCQALPPLVNIRLRGVMTMAPYSQDEALIRSVFRRAKVIYDGLRATPQGAGIDVLSMGMSGDYAIAIEEGSTMVRVGSAIFKGDVQ
jgi:pyridoxal phosphate enzyme (YggS family)